MFFGFVLVAAACAATPDATVDVGGEVRATDANPDSQVASIPAAGTTGASFLLAAPDATQASTAFRTDMFLEMIIDDPVQGQIEMGSPERPLAVGEVQGANSSMVIDIGVLFEPILDTLSPGERSAFLQVFGGDDLSMEMVVVGDVTYMRSPFIASVASQATGLDPAIAPLVNIETEYGSIDSSALGDDLNLGEVSGVGGVNGIDSFEAYLDLIRGSSDVTEVGPSEIRGEPTTEYAVSARLGDLLDAQGIDGSQLGLSSDQLRALDAEVDFGVHVGADGRLRRMVFSFDEEAIAQIAPEGDLPADTAFSMTLTMDMYDFDDASISVSAPPAEQIFGDVTDAFVALSALSG